MISSVCTSENFSNKQDLQKNVLKNEKATSAIKLDARQSDLSPSQYTQLYKVSFTSGRLTKFAQNLYKDACLKHKQDFHEIADRVLETHLKKIRVKGTHSITRKVQRKKGAVSSIKEAPKIIQDMFGAMAVTNGSQKHTDEIISRLAKEAEKGNLTITRIGNAFVKGSSPYLSPENMQLLKKAQKEPIKLAENYKHGYATANIKFKTKRGACGEFQIKGNQCYKIEAATHVIYELKAGRLKTVGRFPKEREKLIKAYKKLTRDQLKNLDKYQAQYYKHLRLEEVGKHTPVPELPKSLPKTFSMENLNRLAQK